MKRSAACLIFVFICFQVFSQPNELTDRIAVQDLVEYENSKDQQRNLLQFRKKRAYFNPLAYLGAGLMFFYQNVLSDQIQATCVYKTSCSEYTKLCIRHFGMLRGMLKGLNQFAECHHSAKAEHPAVMLNSSGQIINSIEQSH